MVDSVLQPMRDLLARYERVAATVEGAISALEAQLHARQKNKPMEPPTGIATLEAQGSAIDTLLEFQERLSELPGVLKVVIAGTKSGRSSFLVELASEAPRLVVCSSCGKVLTQGVPPASHGLCEDCRADFGRSRD